MKYAIVIPDGCADEPQESLGGRTPLEAASIPAMDQVAKSGRVGRSSNVPPSLPAGSDVATLSLLGYDPLVYYTGRAPLEAAAQQIELGPNDWAIRCNLVTIVEQQMRSFTAEQIRSEDGAALIETLRQELGSEQLDFRPGVSYRNLLIYRGGNKAAPFSDDTRTTPPHDLTDKSVLDDYPRGPGGDLLNHLMGESLRLFADHPVNTARKKRGEPPATNIWLWGQGSAPTLKKFAELHGKQGAMITAVDLLRGLATLVGWKRIEVPGATGYLDTDYAAKGRYAIDALDETDVVCVHVEATDEASHEGDTEAKIRALEEIDRHIVAPLHAALRERGEYRLLVSPDHPTPLRTKTHSHSFVPFGMAGSGIEPDAQATYDEVAAAASDLGLDAGWRLMGLFLGTD